MRSTKWFLRICLVACVMALAFGAGATHAQVNAYVASQGSNSVKVLDTATNTVTASVPVSGPRAVTLSPDGQFLYATSSNGMVKIDTATNTAVGTVATGNIPIAIAVTPDGATAYVANNASGTVSVVDTATMTVTTTLSIAPQTIATAPDGSIWVSANILVSPFPAVMAVIDPATNTFTTFPLGHGRAAPSSIAFTPDGAFAYLANFSANLVAVLDVATRTEVATVTAGNRPAYADVRPDGAFVYAANLLGNNVSVIDTATNTVTATIAVGSVPRALAFTPDGAFAYVSNTSSSTISVIDTTTLTVVATISVPGAWGITMPRGNRPPVAQCHNVTVSAGPSCSANASIDNGSSDPDAGDTITLAQSPAGPYGLGSTNVTLTVTDSHGAASSCTGTVTVVDTTPPAITCPAPITANGCLSAGVSVSFTVTATDSCDASPTIVTTPASGSSFPFGTTPVSATATDHSGNSAQCGFTVTVLSSQDQIAALTTQIDALVSAGSLSQSDANPLLNTLSNAAKHLADGQVSQTQKEIADLIKKVAGDVQTGKLAPAAGQALIDAAQASGANLGC